MHHDPTGMELIGALCFIEWGLIHIAAGVVSMPFARKGDLSGYCAAIMNNLPKSTKMKRFDAMREAGSAIEDNDSGWPFLTNRVFIQHSVNLFFVGVSSLIGALAVLDTHAWRHVWLLAFPAFWFDIGYFVAMDLPELGATCSQIQTYIVSVGMIMAALTTNKYHGCENTAVGTTHMEGCATKGEFIFYLICPIAFICTGLFVKIRHATGNGWKPLEAPDNSASASLTVSSSNSAL